MVNSMMPTGVHLCMGGLRPLEERKRKYPVHKRKLQKKKSKDLERRNRKAVIDHCSCMYIPHIVGVLPAPPWFVGLASDSFELAFCLILRKETRHSRGQYVYIVAGGRRNDNTVCGTLPFCRYRRWPVLSFSSLLRLFLPLTDQP